MKLIFPIYLHELQEGNRSYYTHHNQKNNLYWLLFENPIKKIQITENTNVHAQIESFFNELITYPYYFAGFFSFELSNYLLNIKNKHSNSKSRRKSLINLPLIYGGFFSSYKIIDYQNLDKIFEDINIKNSYLRNIKLLENYKKYKEKIIKITNYIKNGNVYQVNYTFPLKIELYGKRESLFFLLWEKQKSTNACFIMDDDFFILSLSPELFFYQNKENIILKPMKGTIHKYNSLKKNIKSIQYLKNSIKEKAENAMIVDLIRNDLGRISHIGTVHLKDVYKIEIYKTIIQMVSIIESKLKYTPKNKIFWESLFPSGSVTGAPKISALQYIYELEEYKREVYTGSIGWIIDNIAKFNVSIRTIMGKKNSCYYFVGSGITYDSIPKKEFLECLNKAKILKEIKKELKPEYIFTTMKFSGSIIYFEKSHLNRILETKKFFEFPISEKKILQKFHRIKKILKNFKYPIRIHFRIYKNGKIQIFLDKLNVRKKLRVCLAPAPVDPQNIFLFYKTSNRNHYYIEKQKFVDEVIFFNNKNYLTEGSFTNIILKIQNQYFTPPIESGLFNGIFRQKLIKKGKITEKYLTIEDLKKSEKIFLINSVRGIMVGSL